jgi:hypothetical protein
MIWLFANDDSGGVSTDWVTLTAGITVLGVVVVYLVMGNSAGYLMDEFEELNEQYATGASDLAVSSREITRDSSRGTTAEQ